MRSNLLVALVFFLSGCAIDLGTTQAEAPPAPAVAVAKSCPLLRDVAGSVLGVAGDARSMAIGQGESLWFLDGLRVHQADGSEPTWKAVSLALPASATVAGCLAGATTADTPTPLFDATGLPSGQSLQPLAPVRAGDKAWLFYGIDVADSTAAFGVRRSGYGVAQAATLAPPFHMGATALWAGDGPSFGGSALVDGADVYVYGCKNAGFLNADCYVARAPADKLDDATAYVYASGGGHWTADVEHAAAMVHAGDPIAVQYQPTQQRYIMAYVTPLGGRLTLRTGLTPTGPWSQPREVAGCELPFLDPGSFCGGVALHPELAGLGADDLAITYTINTFQRPAGLGDASYDARLVVLQVPAGMP